MNKYIAFFRLHFGLNLQYRMAAMAGIMTQFAWGTMEILVFHAFYRSDAAAFPMEITALSSYVWMQQAFLALFQVWFMEHEIFTAIEKGDIAYEFCRPIDIYNLWFSRSIANRLSKALLRAVPILVVAALLPTPYGLSLPKSIGTLLLFIVTMVFALLVTVAICMIIYMLCFFLISSVGIRVLSAAVVELLSGSILPLPFFPESIRHIVELLPFASMHNVPLRIYCGDLSGTPMMKAIALQMIWFILLFCIGHLLKRAAISKIRVQGG